MDNCSHNGEKLQTSVMTVAKAWAGEGLRRPGLHRYLDDESKITFPWSMIDKITPRPHKIVEEQLDKDGIEDMTPIVTSKNTFIAAFVNASARSIWCRGQVPERPSPAGEGRCLL